MVCSRAQHPSHCVFSNVYQHRSWPSSNAEVNYQGPECSQGNRLGSITPDAQLWSTKGYAGLGYANTNSPFKSSWIQRLITSDNTRMEQPHHLDKLKRVNDGIDGVQTNWKDNADHLTILGNWSNFPVYENSRRIKHEFNQTYEGTNTLGCVQNGVNMAATSTLFEASGSRPPEIQFSPKRLPVVESLLPGCPKKVLENETLLETNVPHILSKCMGFAKPMKQTVHYSTNGKSRVSCSSIEGVNSQGAVHAAGDFLSQKALHRGKSCIFPLQPFLEPPFNSMNAVTQSNMYLNFGGKDKQMCSSIHEGWAASVARSQCVEDRLLDASSMSCRVEGIELLQECFSQTNIPTSKMDERLPVGCSMERLTHSKAISKRNCWNSRECHSYAVDDSEALYTREGSFNGGWWSIPNREKDGPRQISNLSPLHCGTHVAKDKTGICTSHLMIEQELNFSHDSHEEQGGTSRSFSFHFETQLASELDHAKVVMRKGQWPFSSSSLSSEDLVQLRWPEDNRDSVPPEATGPSIPLDKSLIVQETGVCEAGAVCISGSRHAPFLGTGNFNESASLKVPNNHDVSLYKAACIDMRGMFTGDMKPLSGSSFNQARDEKAMSLLGGHKLSALESNLMVIGTEGKEPMFSPPSRTVSVSNWKAMEPFMGSSIHTCPLEGTQLNHADGNYGVGDNWKELYASIRSSTHTCPPEGAQLNHADSNLCFSRCSIGSCSKMDANIHIEDLSTRVDARSDCIAQEKPARLPSAALQNKLCTSQRLHGVSSEGESEGKEAVGPVEQNIWLRRWRSGRVQGVAMPEERVISGMRRSRSFLEEDRQLQSSKEFSYCFDHRPAKRVCYEERMQSELWNSFSKTDGEKGVVSHFMKRFLTPSAAAMAIMGTTARQVHATQPQNRGLFGVWVWNDSVRKPPLNQPELCKEFFTRPKCEKELLPTSAKASPIAVDL